MKTLVYTREYDKWPATLGSVLGFMCRWFLIGLLFHTGWRVLP